MRSAVEEGAMRTLLALVLVAFVATQAAAHAVLESTSPASGAVLTTSPAELRLTFSERIEPRFSAVEVLRDGAKVATRAPHADPARNALVLPLPPLAPGRYQVRWRAVSADSHRIEGSFAFEVRP
jgi:methionine-rich copper-binding protein CopC